MEYEKEHVSAPGNPECRDPSSKQNVNCEESHSDGWGAWGPDTIGTIPLSEILPIKQWASQAAVPGYREFLESVIRSLDQSDGETQKEWEGSGGRLCETQDANEESPHWNDTGQRMKRTCATS